MVHLNSTVCDLSAVSWRTFIIYLFSWTKKSKWILPFLSQNQHTTGNIGLNETHEGTKSFSRIKMAWAIIKHWVLSNSTDSANERSKHLPNMITIDFHANRSPFSSVPLFLCNTLPHQWALLKTALLMRHTAKQKDFKRANQQQGLSIQKESGKLYEFFMY